MCTYRRGAWNAEPAFRSPQRKTRLRTSIRTCIEATTCVHEGGPLQDGRRTSPGCPKTRFRRPAHPRQALDSQNDHLEPFLAPQRGDHYRAVAGQAGEAHKPRIRGPALPRLRICTYVFRGLPAHRRALGGAWNAEPAFPPPQKKTRLRTCKRRWRHPYVHVQRAAWNTEPAFRPPQGKTRLRTSKHT